ncbi:alkaline phosphatase family protein [Gordonia insulae]|uniref:alkaline phosphatase family protein n=1 Tax=Gordonia insulae TaxID=2420509 RepID=UPI000F5BD527|nr:nucleotide pyrophosphatase/phosphodiesterase family protein [Gordonia insulae]
MSAPSDELHPLQWSSYATLADVLPAIDDAFDRSPSSSVPIPASRDVVLLLIDGLGATLLDAHADVAPTLTSMRAATIRAGFPATTATSITSLMAGAPCGSHGIIGYSFRTERDETRGPKRRTLNALRWTFNTSHGRSALGLYVPEQIQPNGGVLAEMAGRGVDVTYVMPLAYRGTGFSRAAFRVEGTYVGAHNPAEILAGVGETLTPRTPRHRFVYAYWPDLDAAGHLFGPGSPAWRKTLAIADKLVADLASELPRDATLVVTGDHGMIEADNRIDIDTTDEMLKGVEAVGGEMRVRQVYTRPGARDDVRAFWTDVLGDNAFLVPREQVLDEQWFGAEVTDVVAERIGDLVAVARGTSILTRSLTDPAPEVNMPGHHGAWSAAEQLVPLLVQKA